LESFPTVPWLPPPKSNSDKADRKWVKPAVLGRMLLQITIFIIVLLFYIYDLKNPTPMDVEEVEMLNKHPPPCQPGADDHGGGGGGGLFTIFKYVEP
jgi:hypothetical protein